MFEPLSDYIRLRRKQMGLTQEKLAKMAKVSRRQLSLLEDGRNVSLLFLTKIANALEITDIPVGHLRVFAAPPELSAIMRSAEVVENLKQAFAAWGNSAETIRSASATLEELIAKALAPPPSTAMIGGITDRLVDLPAEDNQAVADTLRILASDSDPARDPAPDADESAAADADSAGRNGR